MSTVNRPSKRQSDTAKKTKVASAARKKKIAKLTGVLAAFVVLCTAWALMVPALSITQESARPEAGFFGEANVQVATG